jgi:hypothetical protein
MASANLEYIGRATRVDEQVGGANVMGFKFGPPSTIVATTPGSF